MLGLFVVLVVVGTSVWVLSDAVKIGARQGLVSGTFDASPGMWFFACLLIWIIAFPGYLVTRPKIIAALEAEKSRPSASTPTPKCLPAPARLAERKTTDGRYVISGSRRRP